MATRQNCSAVDLKIGDVASLTEHGPAIFERVPNVHGYRDGSIVIQSKLTLQLQTWSAHKQVWRSAA